MIYVISDIHGNYAKYIKMIEIIEFSERDTLYILGDVIDREKYGLDVLLDIMKKSNVILLKGNHEFMMENVLKLTNEEIKDSDELQLWKSNGGSVTWSRFRFLLSQEERIQIKEYLSKLPLECNVKANNKQFYLIHGYPIDFLDAYEYDIKEYTSVWERIDKEEMFYPDKTVIFGHTPTYHYQEEKKLDIPLKIWYGNNIIGIDCGCNNKEIGRLACLRLDDMKEYYV